MSGSNGDGRYLEGRLQVPHSLEGWKYRVGKDGETLLCAYNAVRGELRVNKDLANNAGDLQKELENSRRRGCLGVLLGFLGMEEEPLGQFNVIVDGITLRYDSPLAKIGYLKENQKKLNFVRGGV